MVRKVAIKIQAKRCLCGPESVRKDLQRLESSQPLLGKEGEGKTEVLIVSDLFQTSFRIALDLKGLDKIESQSQKRKKKESQRTRKSEKVMRQKMQVRERIVGKIQYTSVDLIDYRWVSMIQACFRAVSGLFLTGFSPDSNHYVASTILYIACFATEWLL